VRAIMRAAILPGLILVALASSADAASNKSCLVCHTPPLFDPEALSKSVHAKLECASCHKGYDFSPHQAKPASWSPKEQELIARIGKSSTAPDALAACGRCHEAARDDWMGSVHGRWLTQDKPAATVTCLDCHGEPHGVPGSKAQTALARNKAYAARCEGCHENAALVKKVGLSHTAVETFRDSPHGRLLALGSNKAPTCASCHGSHDIAKMGSGGGAGGGNKVALCAGCHKGATSSFADTFTHQPIEKRPIPHYTLVGFSWLTTLTVLALVFHVLLDFQGTVRRFLRRRRGEALEEPPAPTGSIKRFDIHQLAQHWIVIAAVVTLVVSDWPLRAPHIASSQTLVAALGGLERATLLHRIAGVALGVAGLYHLIYLTVVILKRDRPLLLMPMMPGLKDARDIIDNILYFLGVRQHPPKFAKYSYIEKFDYWAVFWGVAIMFGTGLVRWFPVFFAKFLPGSLVEAMQVAHGDEATLCVLALFVWHMYNVHLRPAIFPMSWSWIDGRMDYGTLREDHGEEFDKLFPAGTARPAPMEKKP
jgi:cytochrome b subunit of formate dehydrogenase